MEGLVVLSSPYGDHYHLLGDRGLPKCIQNARARDFGTHIDVGGFWITDIDDNGDAILKNWHKTTDTTDQRVCIRCGSMKK